MPSPVSPVVAGWELALRLRQRREQLGIAVRIITNVQHLIWFQINEFQRAAKNLRVGFIGADLTGNENVCKKFGNAEVLENQSQASVKI